MTTATYLPGTAISTLSTGLLAAAPASVAGDLTTGATTLCYDDTYAAADIADSSSNPPESDLDGLLPPAWLHLVAPGSGPSNCARFAQAAAAFGPGGASPAGPRRDSIRLSAGSPSGGDRTDNMIEIADLMQTAVNFLRICGSGTMHGFSIESRGKEKAARLAELLRSDLVNFRRLRPPDNLADTVRLFIQVIQFLKNDKDLAELRDGYSGTWEKGGSDKRYPPSAPDGDGFYCISAAKKLRTAAVKLIDLCASEDEKRRLKATLDRDDPPEAPPPPPPTKAELAAKKYTSNYDLFRVYYTKDFEWFQTLQRPNRFDATEGIRRFSELKNAFMALTALNHTATQEMAEHAYRDLLGRFEELRIYLYLLNSINFNPERMRIVSEQLANHERRKELIVKLGRGELSPAEQMDLARCLARDLEAESRDFVFNSHSGSMLLKAIQDLNTESSPLNVEHMAMANAGWKW